MDEYDIAVHDAFGAPIQLGSEVVYPNRRRSHQWMCRGVVVGIEKSLPWEDEAYAITVRTPLARSLRTVRRLDRVVVVPKSNPSVEELASQVRRLANRVEQLSQQLAEDSVRDDVEHAACPWSYDVVLNSVPERKIPVIREVRSLTGMSLKDSLFIVNQAVDHRHPVVLRSTTRAHANSAIQRLVAVGAGASLVESQ